MTILKNTKRWIDNYHKRVVYEYRHGDDIIRIGLPFPGGEPVVKIFDESDLFDEVDDEDYEGDRGDYLRKMKQEINPEIKSFYREIKINQGIGNEKSN